MIGFLDYGRADMKSDSGSREAKMLVHPGEF